MPTTVFQAKQKKILANNYLKHFLTYLFLVFLLVGVYFLVVFLEYKQLTLTSEIWLLIIGLVLSLLTASIPTIKKGLEEFDPKWAEAFEWFFMPIIKKLLELFKKYLQKK